jgi:CRISPR-associated protein Csm1
VQIFLQGRLLGIEEFVVAGGADYRSLAGRCRYVAVLGELLPRALLRHLHLAVELLGMAAGARFLIEIPAEARASAEEWIAQRDARLRAVSGGRLRLIAAITENLGDWSDIRRRLSDEERRQAGTPWASRTDVPAEEADFTPALAATGLTYDEDVPGMISWTGEALPLTTHTALADDGASPASPEELGARAAGRPLWGVLRAEVDESGARLRRAMNVEEYCQAASLYKRFFEGELGYACAAKADNWRKVTILYTGADDFAVFGAWDALIGVARELERLFQRLVSEVLHDAAGAEGKTISMALALAPSTDTTLRAVWAEAKRQMESAKAIGKDSISLLGRVVEWKQLNEAADLKQTMVRLVDEYGANPQYLSELGSFYRESEDAHALQLNRTRSEIADRPWRFHRRLSRLLDVPGARRDFEKAKSELLGEFIRRKQAHIKLRPAGRVALEWARLETGQPETR